MYQADDVILQVEMGSFSLVWSEGSFIEQSADYVILGRSELCFDLTRERSLNTEVEVNRPNRAHGRALTLQLYAR